MRIIEIDNYLDSNIKMIIIYIGLCFVLSFLSVFNSNLSFTSILISFLYLGILFGIFIIVKLKKSLVFQDGELYNALTYERNILFRKKVETGKFISGKVKKLNKNSGFWPWFGPITGLLREYNATVISLIEKEGNEIKILHLTNIESTKEAIEFIENNTKIKFPEYYFLK